MMLGADDILNAGLLITAQPAHKLRALQAGAKDFISKPFDLLEVKTRIHNILEVRLLYKKLENYNELLERAVRERTAELRASEARFRRLTELASDWFWEQNETGVFTQCRAQRSRWSASACRHFWASLAVAARPVGTRPSAWPCR